MTLPSPLPFPSGRTLAAWWRQINALRAHSGHRGPAFWVAHLAIHRVEALARVSHEIRPDRFALLLLETLAFDPGAAPERMRLVFPFADSAIRRLLRQLETQELVRTDSSDRWHLTERGQQARASKIYHRPELQRRVFHFVESDRPDRPPHFLPLRRTGWGHRVVAEASFDARHLFESARKGRDWKQRHGFPLEVDELLSPMAGDDPADWQRIILHHLEILPVVLRTENEGPRLVGFHADSNAASLELSAPMLELGDCWPEVLPDLVHEPAVDHWHQGWCEWAKRQGISAVDAEKCRVERREHRLRVNANRPILERLRSSRNEPLKYENCVMVGDGRFRAVAPLEIVTG